MEGPAVLPVGTVHEPEIVSTGWPRISDPPNKGRINIDVADVTVAVLAFVTVTVACVAFVALSVVTLS